MRASVCAVPLASPRHPLFRCRSVIDPFPPRRYPTDLIGQTLCAPLSSSFSNSIRNIGIPFLSGNNKGNDRENNDLDGLFFSPCKNYCIYFPRFWERGVIKTLGGNGRAKMKGEGENFLPLFYFHLRGDCNSARFGVPKLDGFYDARYDRFYDSDSDYDERSTVRGSVGSVSRASLNV